MRPLQKHAFRIKALKKLYFAKTKKSKIFRQNDKDNNEVSFRDYSLNKIFEENHIFKNTIQKIKDYLKSEVLQHNTIRLFFKDWLFLFFGLSSNKELNILYEKGCKRLNFEMNFVNIIKKLRYLEIIIEAGLITNNQRKFLIEHSNKNTIEIDEDYEFKESEINNSYEDEKKGKSQLIQTDYEGGQ